jgi:hypothetical protein
MNDGQPAGGTDPNEDRPVSDRLFSLIPAAQREVLRQALADAVQYRDPPLDCRACDACDGLCDQCTAGLTRARAYLGLGRELGLAETLVSHAPARPDVPVPQG